MRRVIHCHNILLFLHNCYRVIIIVIIIVTLLRYPISFIPLVSRVMRSVIEMLRKSAQFL